MNAFLTQLGMNSTQAYCASGTWQYTGDINMGDHTWDIDTDFIQLTGSLTGSPSATIIMSITPGTPGVPISVQNTLTPDLTVLTVNLATAPVGYYAMAVVRYATLAEDQNNQDISEFNPQTPILPNAYSTCRQLNKQSPPGVFYYPFNITMTVDILQNPNVPCDGVNDRTWAIAIMIILSLHAICLMLFCLITCKNEGLKEKWWDGSA